MEQMKERRQISYGNGGQKGKGNGKKGNRKGKGNRRSFDCVWCKERTKLRSG
jgi:hypothetical protein